MAEMIKMDLIIEEISDGRVLCNSVKYIIMNRPISSLNVGDRLSGKYWPDKFNDRDDSSRLVLANKFIIDRVFPAVKVNDKSGKGDKANKADIAKAIA